MRKTFIILGIILSIIAAMLTCYSNTDFLRKTYKNIICRQLGKGINKLFINPNKYRNSEIKQRYVGKFNYFFLQKGKDPEFEIMKDFILDNFHTRNLGYEVKAIVQFQARSLANDVENLNFIFRPAFFIKETEANKTIDFASLSSDATIEDRDDAILITDEGRLTQNLDTFFSNRIRNFAFFLIVIVAISNSISALKNKSYG